MVTISGKNITFCRKDVVNVGFSIAKDGEASSIESGQNLIMAVRNNNSGNVREFDVTDGTFVLSSEESSCWASGSYQYEIRIQYDDSNRSIVLQNGMINVQEVIT